VVHNVTSDAGMFEILIFSLKIIFLKLFYITLMNYMVEFYNKIIL